MAVWQHFASMANLGYAIFVGNCGRRSGSTLVILFWLDCEITKMTRLAFVFCVVSFFVLHYSFLVKICYMFVLKLYIYVVHIHYIIHIFTLVAKLFLSYYLVVIFKWFYDLVEQELWLSMGFVCFLVRTFPGWRYTEVQPRWSSEFESLRSAPWKCEIERSWRWTRRGRSWIWFVFGTPSL